MIGARALLLSIFVADAAAAPPSTPVPVGAGDYFRPVPYDEYEPPGNREAPLPFEGRLIVRPRPADAHIDVLRDDYDDARDPSRRLAEMPLIDAEFVVTGDALVPMRSGLVVTGHPRWDYILGTGRLLRRDQDRGYGRAVMPFALAEKNANCVHNGVLSFLYRADGTVSKVAYQVSSETCMYLKADLWGYADAEFRPGPVAGKERKLADRGAEEANVLPRRPIADLARRYPGVDVASYASPGDVREITTYGVVADGVFYAGGCPTRAGEYPFCAQLVLPSYSLAKSMFAGLALMRLEKIRPGTAREGVSTLVPECRASGRWDDVTLLDLLDMTSGNFVSDAPNADEASAALDNDFFLAATHAQKVAHACDGYPRGAPPGTLMVYRTSDTYLLGVAMTNQLRSMRGSGADLVDDLAWPDIWRGMGLPPRLATVRRTADERAQPLAGYGLYFEPADVARIAQLLDPGSPLAGVDEGLFREALQRDPARRGQPVPGEPALLYQHGFWALRVEELPGCEAPVYVPFLSGYGGISVVLMPNGVSYFYFSDGGDFRFARAVRESARIRPYCGADTRGATPEESRG